MVYNDSEIINPSFSELSNLTLPYRISGIRDLYKSGDIDFDSACNLITNKRDFSSYVVFSGVHDNGFKEYVISKCSFRGNDVYRARVWNRHLELLRFCELNKDKSFIVSSKDSGFVSSVLKFTLTVDPKRFSRDDFNSSMCSYYYDLFIKSLRNHYPDVVIARSYEVSTKKARGYLHVNVVAVFPDCSFPVYLHKSKKSLDRNGNPVESWRLKNYSDKTSISDFWECGFVDIRSVKDPNDLAEYSLKYHIKEFTKKSNKSNQDLTMAVLSLYNKRAFSFPRASVARGSADFVETVINYTVGLDSSDPVVFPRLDIINHNSLDYVFEGFFYDIYNGYDPKVWNLVLEHPPPEIDPVCPYENYMLNPNAVELCVFDSGARLINDYFVNPVFVPKKSVCQKRFKRDTNRRPV